MGHYKSQEMRIVILFLLIPGIFGGPDCSSTNVLKGNYDYMNIGQEGIDFVVKYQYKCDEKKEWYTYIKGFTELKPNKGVENIALIRDEETAQFVIGMKDFVQEDAGNSENFRNTYSLVYNKVKNDQPLTYTFLKKERPLDKRSLFMGSLFKNVHLNKKFLNKVESIAYNNKCGDIVCGKSYPNLRYIRINNRFEPFVHVDMNRKTWKGDWDSSLNRWFEPTKDEFKDILNSRDTKEYVSFEEYRLGDLKEDFGSVQKRYDFFNIWFCIKDCNDTPLGVIRPSTIKESMCEGASLRCDENHEWLLPNYQDGDAIVFPGITKGYHAGFPKGKYGSDVSNSERTSFEIRCRCTWRTKFEEEYDPNLSDQYTKLKLTKNQNQKQQQKNKKKTGKSIIL
jgi:hypothetical protein